MWTIARRKAWAGFATLLLVAGPTAAAGQDAGQQQVSAERLTAYTKAFAEISQVRDEIQAKLAASPNKTIEAQAQLRESLKQRSEAIITAAGLTLAEYTRVTWLISIDDEVRQRFEAMLARLTAEKTSGG